MSAPGRATRRTAIWRDRRMLVIIVVVTALVIAAGVPAVLWLTKPHQAQLVVTNTGGLPTAMIEEPDRRILILNTEDREEALAIVSRLSMALSSRLDVVIAPANDEIAPALLAIVDEVQPATVIVAGAPGAAPAWTSIEQSARRLGIDVRYTGDLLTIDDGQLQVSVLGTRDEAQAAAVVVRRRAMSVVIALTSGRIPAAGQTLVTANPNDAPHTDLIVTTDDTAGRQTQQLEVVVERGDTVRVELEPASIQVFGGTRRMGND